MPIRMIIDIGALESGPKNEFGVGVNVHTEPLVPFKTPDNEGATWVGLCTAINTYMRSRGAHGFDCMKRGVPL